VPLYSVLRRRCRLGNGTAKSPRSSNPQRFSPSGVYFFENYINQISLASYGRSFSGAARHAQVCGRLAEDRCPALWRPAVEHATCRSQVRRPNHDDATEPHTWNDPVQAAVVAWRNAVPFTVSGCWIVRQKVDVYPGGWGGGLRSSVDVLCGRRIPRNSSTGAAAAAREGGAGRQQRSSKSVADGLTASSSAAAGIIQTVATYTAAWTVSTG